jgi:imidazolonepropionase-like amidohydrolase
MTLHPAEFLRIADRVGSLGPGKDGNLLILSGDPLDPRTRVQTVVLEGQVVYREAEVGTPE